jgi:hypothetical protein
MTDLFRNLAEGPEPHTLRRGLWGRRAVMAVFTAIVVVALANGFGQVTHTSAARGPAARMSVAAPERVRGGLLFQARVDVRALRRIEQPRFVLARGWVEGMQVSSIEPSPASEQSRDGDLLLSYDALDGGERMTIWFQFQVDPTSVGRRSYDLELDDAREPLVRLRRTLTVLP